MSKRFTDTDIREKNPWFRKLSPTMKEFWRYVCDKCDSAGVWVKDFDTAAFLVNAPLNESEIRSFFLAERDADQLPLMMELNSREWLLPQFVNFQYAPLSEDCKAHIPIFKAIEKHGFTKYLTEVQLPKDKIGYTLDFPKPASPLTPCPNSVPTGAPTITSASLEATATSTHQDTATGAGTDTETPKGDNDTSQGGDGEKAVVKPHRVFSDAVDRLYESFCGFMLDAKHSTYFPKTQRQIEDAKDVLRLMMEQDRRTEAEIEEAIRFVASDTGDGRWAGWRRVVQSFSGFRGKWGTISKQLDFQKDKGKPTARRFVAAPDPAQEMPF